MGAFNQTIINDGMLPDMDGSKPTSKADWEAVEHDFAASWRPVPKWTVSRSLKSLGANATLVSDDETRWR
jgi:hypothetical protein